ncbi:MAG: DNA helicase RecQ [Clostridiales Family XIII bacterium]|jgi:ATP-dependent DNA helicase RecQ|nr:DNA helicase RecQ [Clostridiales Family XIII bacterium]
MEKQLAVLGKYFGYSEFRQGQSEIISRTLNGEDVLGVMPTGAGKSICYQIPALMLEGTAIVISPLISLMKDQVSGLCQAGVRACLLNSSLSAAGQRDVITRAAAGEFKLLYVAPERLLMDDFADLASRMRISAITVDEAHCVSQWGQDFRPSYLDIPVFVGRLKERPPISAFTATATNRVKGDIAGLLGLRSPYTISTGFDRKNLFFSVLRPKDKMKETEKYLDAHIGKSGIVYCATRRAVEEVCAALCAKGHAATRYHAGLSDAERATNQEDFLYDRKTVMVATNAFGMGIDKSNVGFVIHYNMPKNIESYYQEAGRAGRDGSPADCLLLYSGMDVRTNRFLIMKSIEGNEELTPEIRESLMQKDEELLKAMVWYSTSADCLRERILRYFGEQPPGYCGNCSNCLGNYETVDVSLEARKIISCVYRLRERNRSFGKTVVAQILHGDANQKISGQGLDTLSTYGIMRDTPVRKICGIIEHLVRLGHLYATGGQYPVIELGQSYAEVTRDNKQILMKSVKYAEPLAKPPAKGLAAGDGAAQTAARQTELYERLRALRSRLASEAKIPAFHVFSDATLHAICAMLPTDGEEFLKVPGVGQRKNEMYGAAFTDEVKMHIDADRPQAEKALAEQ